MAWAVYETGPRGGLHRREWCDWCKTLHEKTCPKLERHLRRIRRETDELIERRRLQDAEEQQHAG